MRKVKSVLYGIHAETQEIKRVTQSPRGILALDGGFEFRTSVRRGAWWAAAMFHLIEIIVVPVEEDRPDHPALLGLREKLGKTAEFRRLSESNLDPATW
ncbi:hypothetical protein [Mesorhizobium sp. B1-1-8]|uniref:hypothetical protein n=1 Tax=Mesorhizobium sp. B1-1-8 TaxID=2589976 RepID=UPI00112AED5F|nr:hypothetical protein [Mesorhizobium sp. B1-1-8]UCI07352.1 hypothetical protein FJ974_26810 [Mesorhizobium sp. B1-1-8]